VRGTSAPTGSEPEVVIKPPGELLRLDLGEFYRYRYLLKTLIWRNLRTQFDEQYFSMAWVCVRPLLFVAVFAAFRKLSSANTHVAIPYALYLYSGLALWYYFVEATSETASAVRNDAHLLTKVYYPRLITPLVPTLAHLANLAVSLTPLALMMAWYQVGPGWRLILLPVVIAQTACLALGLGALFAALTLTNRDWERFLGFGLYLGLFVSPVIYSPEMIPESVRLAYFVNPMAGGLLAFRAALFAAEPFPGWQWLYSAAVSFCVLLLGIRVYRAAEAGFADRL
jgi:lipopolysaccharide transport system permease protein